VIRRRQASLSLLLAATCSGSVPLPRRLAQIDVRGRDVAEHKSSKNASNALVSTSIRSAAIDAVAGRGVAPTGPSVTAAVGDIRTTMEGGVIHVHGKRNKDRRVPLQPPLMQDQPALG
jgi:hypothetical protein